MRVQRIPPDLIPTMEEAEETLGYVYRSLFLLAGVAALGGAVVQPTLLLVALLFASLGFFLRQYHSRNAAVIVALIAAGNLIRVLITTTVAFPASASDFIGSLLNLADGVLGSALDLVVAIAAVYAASRYQAAEKAFNCALAQAEKARSA